MSVNAPIRVCVLEGLYAQLLRANCPLSVAVELQTRGLCLDSAKWSMRYSDGGFSVAFFWPTQGQSYAATTTQSRRRRRRRKPRSRPETEGPNAIRREQPNKRAKRYPESVNRKLSLIDEHPSSQCTLVTPIWTTSSAVTEVDVPADVPDMEVDSAVPGTEDTELETDSPSSELSGTDEPSDSDSMVENDLDQLCTAKSTEFKMRNNIPGFDYISNTGHHGWTPVRVQRLGTKGSEFDATFLQECDEVSFLNVGGCLRAKVRSSQTTFLTPISARTRSKTDNKPP